jgi:hypothetical protein
VKRNLKYYIGSLLALVAVFLVRGQFAGMPVNQWTAAADMSVSRADACSVRLSDGRVLVSGGTTEAGAVASAEMYSTDGTFNAVAPMSEPRANAACVQLASGSVLVMGGSSGSMSLASAELYDPTKNQWSDAGSMTVARSGHTATVTPWGLVVVAGGEETGLVEAYGTNGQFITLGNLSTPREGFAFAATEDHKVLIAGGTDGSSTLSTIEMYDADINKISTVGRMLVARKSFAASALYDGTLLISGGIGESGDTLASTEVFDIASGASKAGPALSVARAYHKSYTLPNNGSVLVLGGNSASAPITTSETYEPWSGTFRGPVGMRILRSNPSSAVLRRGGVMVIGGKGSSGYLSGTERYTFATLESAKPDYQPGEVASFTGMGWRPGEQVVLKISAFPIDQHNVEFTGAAEADSTGQIKIGGFNIDRSHSGVRFLATLSGSQSQAQTTFTDATFTGVVSINLSSSSQTFGTGVTVSGNVTDGTANTVNSGTVTVFSDGVSVATSATVTTGTYSVALGGTAIAPGNHQITVTYGGGGDSGGNTVTTANAGPVSYNVTNTVLVTVTAPASGNSAALGTAVTLTAQLAPQNAAPALSTGTVTFNVSGGCSGALSPNPFTIGPVSISPANQATTTYSLLPASCPLFGGTSYSITATYNPVSGNGYSSATSGPNQYDVNPVTPGITLGKSPAGDVVFGTTLTFNETLTGIINLVPKGNGGLLDNALNILSPQGLSASGTTTFTTSTLAVGPHTISASYTSSDNNYNSIVNSGGVGQSFSFNVTKAPSSTAVTSTPSGSAAFGQSVTLTATVASASATNAGWIIGGTGNFIFDGGNLTGSCQAVTVSGGLASCNVPAALLTLGSHSFSFHYLSDTSVAASLVAAETQGSITINNATSTTVVSAASATNALGTTVVYTATVTVTPTGSAPAGASTVAFRDNGSNGGGTLCGGLTDAPTLGAFASGVATVTCSITYDGTAGKTAGAHSITATWTPPVGAAVTGSNNLPGGYSETISKANITFTGSPTFLPVSPISIGTTDTVSIGVGVKPANVVADPSPLSFNILDGASVVGTTPITFNATDNFALPSSVYNASGSHSITFAFAGDVNYNAVTSGASVLTVNKADPTIATNGFSLVNTYGNQMVVGAKVTGPVGGPTPTGQVTFSIGGTTLGSCTLAAGICTLNFTNAAAVVGANTVTMAYAGDSSYNAGSNTGTLNVGTKNTPNPSFTANPPSPQPFSTNVTFTLALTASGTGAVGTPTGTVSFTDNGNPMGSGPITLVNGSASISTSTLTPGTHSIGATYSGDSNFAAPVIAPLSYTINTATTTVTLSPSPSTVAVGGTVTYNYTVTGGPANVQPVGLVTIQDNGNPISNGSGTCVPTGNGFSGGNTNVSIGSCTVIYDKGTADRGLGAHTMTAQYVPSGVSAGVLSTTTSLSSIVTVTLKQVTISTPASSAGNSITYGTQTQFSATLTPGSPTPAYTGPVIFYDNGSQIASIVSGSGTPQTALLTLTAGTHQITAQFSGGAPNDVNYSASPLSAALTVTVSKAKAPLTLSGSLPAYTVTYGGFPPDLGTTNRQSLTTGLVTVAAVGSGGTPSGTVTVSSNGIVIATNPLNNAGTTTFTTVTMPNGINAGAGQNLTFTYSGDSNYLPPDPLSGTNFFPNGLNVNPALSSAVVTSTPINSVAYGQNVTFTATLSGPGSAANGVITFTSDGVAINASCTAATPNPVTNNVATCTAAATTANHLGAGTHAITVTQFADTLGNHTLPTANITPIAAFVVTPPSPTITITSDVNPSVYGQTVNLTATACGPAAAPAPVGQIQFFDGAASLGTLRQKTGSAANCSTYTLAVPSTGVSLFNGGVHAISATYIALQNDNVTPDPNYVGGNSQTQVPPGVLQQTVNQAPSVTSQITVTANPASIVFGESVTLTVTVKPTGSNAGTPTGLVAFTMNGNPLGSPVTLQNVAGQQTAALTLNTLPVGTDNILATYQGDANFASSQSNNGTPLAVPVAKDATLTVINTGSWPNPATYGGQITLSATVCGLKAGVSDVTATFNDCSTSLPAKPTGTVKFFDGVTLLGTTGNIDANGNASITVLMQNPPFPNSAGGAVPGAHTITAVYQGDGDFLATSSGQQAAQAQTLTINKGATTTSVTTSVNPSVYGQPVQFTATVAAPNSNATLPTGSVDFVDGGVVIAQNVPLTNVGGVMTATLIAGPSGPAAVLAVGQHTISVVYHGDNNYATSSTPISGPQALVQTVNKAATTTSISSSANAANTGQQITLTAVVAVTSPGTGTPTGSVQFINQNAPISPTVLGTSPVVVTAVPGVGNLFVATLVLTNGLPAGNPQIIASYSGDTNFLASQSPVLVQAVNKTPTNIVFTSSLNPSIYGNQVTFNVQVLPVPPGSGTPTGQIQIFDGTVSLGTFTLQGGVYSFTTASLAPGLHAIAVQYNGDTNFQPFTSPAIQQNVSKIPTSLNMTANAFTAVASQVITLTAVLNPNPVPGVPFASGQVGFYDGTSLIGVANLQSNVATLNVNNLSVGLHQLSAIYTGDDRWTGSTSGFFAETITLASTSTQIVSSANPSVYGQPVTFTVTVSVPFPGTVPASGQVQISDNHNNIGDPISANNGTFSITFNNFTPGVHNIVATFLGNASFASSQSATLPQVVNKAATTTTLAALPNGSTSNQQVTLTAVVSVVSPGVGGPTGTIEFVNTTFQQSLGTAPLKLIGGVYVATLTTAQLNQSGSPQVLTASYSGDDDFATSTSNPQGQSVFGTQVTAVNGASQTVANYAPDMWVTLYGDNMANTTLTASQNPYPNSLGGTTVTITDANGTVRQAPLYFVSPGQINMLIPTNTAFGLATLTVTNPNGATSSTIILVTRTAPGLFTASQNGSGVAAALVQRVKSDGTQSIEQVVQFDSSGKPVALPINVGTDSIYLQFYGTGIRYNPGLTSVKCTIGGQSAQVLYAGAAPGFQGLDQVNVALPAGFNLHGTVNVVVTVDGQAANTVTLAFQ